MDHNAQLDFIAMAQFYDLLMRETVAARITHLLEGLLTATGAAPQDGVLDVAAGSGVMAQVVAHRFPKVPVTAVEPSAAMRVALWTTMASDPVMRAAVRVLPIVAEDMNVHPAHDLALCMWAMHNFRPSTRTQVWRRIRDGLTPGGRLLIEKPAEAHATPSTLAEHELGRASIGTDTITLTASTRPTGPQTQDWTFRYHLTDQAGATMGQWLGGGESWRVGNDDLVAELREAGFSIETTLDDLTSNGQDTVGQVYVARR